jgi:hypothetical protein
VRFVGHTDMVNAVKFNAKISGLFRHPLIKLFVYGVLSKDPTEKLYKINQAMRIILAALAIIYLFQDL